MNIKKRFIPINDEETSTIRRNWHPLTLHHEIFRDEYFQILEWLNINIIGHWATLVIDTNNKFYFSNEEDKVLVKLRWL
jgi:hypothetical protein